MRDKRETMIFVAAGILPVTWLALKLAPWWHDGLLNLAAHFDEIYATIIITSEYIAKVRGRLAQ